jgi:hypothetical protein
MSIRAREALSVIDGPGDAATAAGETHASAASTPDTTPIAPFPRVPTTAL